MSLFDSPEFNRALFFPRPDRSPPPAGAQDLFVEVEAARLHVRFHGPAGAEAVVLLFHGNGEVVADYDLSAPRFAAAGASLAVIDYRGYGASSGVPTLRSCLRDAPAVLAAVGTHARGRPLFVMGRSLGGACAAELCTGDRSQIDVAGFIFESAAAELEGVVRRRGLSIRGISEADRGTFDPLPKLARCRRPVLVLHGDQDVLIAPQEAKRSFESLRVAERQLVLLPGVGHNDIALHPEYWRALAAFFARQNPSAGSA